MVRARTLRRDYSIGPTVSGLLTILTILRMPATHHYCQDGQPVERADLFGRPGITRSLRTSRARTLRARTEGEGERAGRVERLQKPRPILAGGHRQSAP